MLSIIPSLDSSMNHTADGSLTTMNWTTSQDVVLDEEARMYEIRSWGWWLLQIGTPLVTVVGIIGNVLSFIVLKSRRYRDKSYSHYLCSLAVFDSLVLIGKYVQRLDGLLTATGHVGIFESFGDATCKVHNFAEHVCYLMSSWLVLFMTLERYIAVKHPFKKDSYCRPRNALVVILVAFAIMSYSQIFRLVVIESVQGLCTSPERYRHVYVALHIYLYQLLLQFLLPALLILACNMSILRKIRQLKATAYRRTANADPTPTSGQTGNGRSSNSWRRQTHKTTAMLLIVSFTFVITIFPNILVSLLLHISILTDRRVAEFLYDKLEVVHHLFEFLSELNYASNFCIYVLSGLQFRYALKNICSERYFFISSIPQTEKVFHFRKFASNS